MKEDCLNKHERRATARTQDEGPSVQIGTEGGREGGKERGRETKNNRENKQSTLHLGMHHLGVICNR